MAHAKKLVSALFIMDGAILIRLQRHNADIFRFAGGKGLEIQTSTRYKDTNH